MHFVHAFFAKINVLVIPLIIYEKYFEYGFFYSPAVAACVLLHINPVFGTWSDIPVIYFCFHFKWFFYLVYTRFSIRVCMLLSPRVFDIWFHTACRCSVSSRRHSQGVCQHCRHYAGVGDNIVRAFFSIYCLMWNSPENLTKFRLDGRRPIGRG